MNKALFLDRDGVINQRIVDGYVQRPEEFVLIPGILPVLQMARQLEYRLILISNQQGVGKGLMSTADLERVTEHMQMLLAEQHLQLDAVYYCTDLASSMSPRRKPAPGMLLEAMVEHHLNAEACWFLGDSITDAQAGRAAGVHTALIGYHPHNAADLVAETVEALLPELRVALTESTNDYK